MSHRTYAASSFGRRLIALLLSPEQTRYRLPRLSVGRTWLGSVLSWASLLGGRTLSLPFDRVTGLREGSKGEKLCIFQMLPWSSL